MFHSHDAERREPRWPAVLAVFASIALHFALPPELRIGQPGLLAAVVVALVALGYLARARRWGRTNEVAGWGVLVSLALGLTWNLCALLTALVHHTERAPDLLRSAGVLWATNCLVFACWYWRLDAGGPSAREQRLAHTSGAFLFPQMAVPAPGEPGRTLAEAQGWHPGFVDYLFVAFNTSTAFSPTDVPVLSRWAKGAMMIQSTISFTAVVLLAARAVNIL